MPLSCWCMSRFATNATIRLRVVAPAALHCGPTPDKIHGRCLTSLSSEFVGFNSAVISEISAEAPMAHQGAPIRRAALSSMSWMSTSAPLHAAIPDLRHLLVPADGPPTPWPPSCSPSRGPLLTLAGMCCSCSMVQSEWVACLLLVTRCLNCPTLLQLLSSISLPGAFRVFLTSAYLAGQLWVLRDLLVDSNTQLTLRPCPVLIQHRLVVLSAIQVVPHVAPARLGVCRNTASANSSATWASSVWPCF